jgi:hypothetical protein
MSEVYYEMKYTILSVTIADNVYVLISSNIKTINRLTDVCDLKDS